MPLGLDQGVGALVWSPLGWGRLTGKIRRGQPLPKVSRLHKTADDGPPVADEFVYRVVDASTQIAKETGKSVPQIALNWLLQRPTVCERHHRRAQRRATPPEPRRRGLEPDPEPGRQTRRRQRRHARLSLLAPAHRRPAQSGRGSLRSKEVMREARPSGRPVPPGRLVPKRILQRRTRRGQQLGAVLGDMHVVLEADAEFCRGYRCPARR